MITTHTNIEMDQLNNLKQNMHLGQANKVITCLHQLLLNSNDKKVSSEARYLEALLEYNGKELNNKDFKENRWYLYLNK